RPDAPARRWRPPDRAGPPRRAEHLPRGRRPRRRGDLADRQAPAPQPRRAGRERPRPHPCPLRPCWWQPRRGRCARRAGLGRRARWGRGWCAAVPAASFFHPLLRRLAPYPGTPVARQLREGDEIGHGFTVLETPGHSAGHVAFWRERDRVLIAGDVLFNLHLSTLRPGLREPPKVLTIDPERNRTSARRLADLQPELVLFGHGPPLRDAAKLRVFTASMPAG